MFVCTTLYWTISIYNFIVDTNASADLSGNVGSALACIFYSDASNSDCVKYGDDGFWSPLPSHSVKVPLQFCTGSAVLTINVCSTTAPVGFTLINFNFCVLQMVLGDAIVWWRMCLLWPRNRVVRGVGAVFLLASLCK